MELRELREELLKLLREEPSVRSELIAILYEHPVLMELKRLREDFNRHEEENSKRFHAVEEELKRLREDFNRHEEENSKRFHAVEEELKRLREDFNRHEEENSKRFHAVEEELKRLREDFMKLSHWMVGIAGYRWGMASEASFREAVDYIARGLGYPIVGRRLLVDRDGSVTGFPGREVEVNVCVKDGRHMLVEVTMYAKREDLWTLAYASRIYEREVGVRPELILVTPFISPSDMELAEKLDVKVISA
jgi:hypothetical protein